MQAKTRRRFRVVVVVATVDGSHTGEWTREVAAGGDTDTNFKIVYTS